MSKSSDIRTAINQLVEDTLTGYVKLSDALDPDDNAVINLEKGYSTGVLTAVNQSDIICPGNTRVERSFGLVLTNAYSPGLDADYRENLENALLDDVETLINALEVNNVLGGLAIDSRYVDDSGIEYLTTDRKQFILIILTVTVDYFQ